MNIDLQCYLQDAIPAKLVADAPTQCNHLP